MLCRNATVKPFLVSLVEPVAYLKSELQPTAVPFTQEGGFFLRSWGPVSANEDGYFILPMLLNGASISIQCESAPVVSLVAATGTTPGQLGEITIPSSGAPIVSALTASF